jgi:hypothetical protein
MFSWRYKNHYLVGSGLSSSSGVPGTDETILSVTGCADSDLVVWVWGVSDLSGNERELLYGLRFTGAGEEPRDLGSTKLLLGHLSAEPITWEMHASIWFFNSWNKIYIKVSISIVAPINWNINFSFNLIYSYRAGIPIFLNNEYLCIFIIFTE